MIGRNRGHSSNLSTLSMTRLRMKLVSVKQRRSWMRRLEKKWLVAASFEPGLLASAVAREACVHATWMFRWRKLIRERVLLHAPVPVLVLVAARATRFSTYL